MAFDENRMNPDRGRPKRLEPPDPNIETNPRLVIVISIVFLLAIASVCGLGAHVRSTAANADAGPPDAAR